MAETIDGAPTPAEPAPGAAAGGAPGGFGFDRPKVDPKEVAFFHQGDDVDQNDGAHHHTLGSKRGQAARGTDLAELASALKILEAAFGAGLGFQRANRVRNPQLLVNQRGYVSGATLIPQQYGPDGWCASGLVNLMPNPTAGTNVTGWLRGGDLGAVTRATGLTIPGMPGVTTGFRTTPPNGNSAGIFNQGAQAAGANAVTVKPGQVYTITAWVHVTTATTMFIAAEQVDSASNNQGSTGSTGPGVAVAANTWTRLTFSFTTKPNAARIGVYVYRSSGTWNGTTVLTVAAAMTLEGDLTSNMPDYFDGSYSGASWTGTAHASTSYSVAAAPTITLPASPGALATLSSGGRIFQAFEREGSLDFMVDWEGTAQGRVYLASTPQGARPAFAAAPLAFAYDGSGDYIVELQATGGARTFGNVQVIPGTARQPFVPRLMAEEVALCRRYLWRVNGTAFAAPFGIPGMQFSTLGAVFYWSLPVKLRTASGGIITAQSVAAGNPMGGVAAAGTISSPAITDGSAVQLRIDWVGAFGGAGTPSFIFGTAAGAYLQIDDEVRAFAA